MSIDFFQKKILINCNGHLKSLSFNSNELSRIKGEQIDYLVNLFN